jgi:hypothetical protein
MGMHIYEERKLLVLLQKQALHILQP